MIVVRDFIEVVKDPLQSVTAQDFGVSKFCFCTDEIAKLVAVWNGNEGKEQKLSLFDFEKRLKFSLKGAFIYAKFEPRAEQIWLFRRDSSEQISVQIYNYTGELKCELTLPDELADSDVWADELTQIGDMAVGLGAGQDGSRTFLPRMRNNELKIAAKLVDNVSFLFAFSQGKKAALLNYYESEIMVVSYPELKPLGAFKFPHKIVVDGETSEFMFGEAVPISDEIWLITNSIDFRHYIFDVLEFKFICEIVPKGFEPSSNKQGEIVSNISNVRISEDKFIFYYYELANEQNRYFTADAVEIMKNLALMRLNYKALF